MRMMQRVLRKPTLSRRPRLHSRKLPEKGTGAFRRIAEEGAGGKGLERYQTLCCGYCTMSVSCVLCVLPLTAAVTVNV
jgi:hypothetical protein